MTRVNTLNEISDIYSSSVINESAEKNNLKVGKQDAGDELEEEKNVKSGIEQKSDPSKVTGVEKPIDEDNSASEKKSEKKSEENHYLSGNTYEENINNGTTNEHNMKKKSIFDKLYEDVLGGDDDEMDMDLDMDTDLSDDESDEDGFGEDEVTVTLPRDVAQQLCDMLKDQLGDSDGDEGEDFEDIW